jgi:hypothetical protein
MNELLDRLRDDSQAFEQALGTERAHLEQSLQALSAEAQTFETVTGNAERHLELMMSNAAARAAQLTANFVRETERLNEASETANKTLGAMIASLSQANGNAQALIGQTMADAKKHAKTLVGDAMAECEKLLRTSQSLTAEAESVRAALGKIVEDVQAHMVTLPGIAQQEARRVRDMVRTESEEILDVSARTLSTIHARTTARIARKPNEPAIVDQVDTSEGLLGLAKRLTQRQRKKPEAPPASMDGRWEMKTLLAAAGTEDAKDLKPAGAAALGALEAALADMAVDLDGITTEGAPGDDVWKKYLAGDRSVFARRLAESIDDDTVNRIATLYREEPRFRDAANAYIAEFEVLLARAREGDGGLLASTMLSADTGKVYLAVAYALGRL